MEVDRTYIGVYYYIMIVVVPTMFVFIYLEELIVGIGWFYARLKDFLIWT